MREHKKHALVSSIYLHGCTCSERRDQKRALSVGSVRSTIYDTGTEESCRQVRLMPRPPTIPAVRPSSLNAEKVIVFSS